MKNFKPFFFWIAVTVLVACSKDESLQQQTISLTASASDPDVEFKNKLLNDYAMVLARAVE